MPRTYDQYCSVAAALDRLGDRWTLLLLRDLAWYGPNRFTDLKRHNRGIPPALLTERLDRLVDEGVVERHQGSYRLIDPDGQIRNLIDLLSRFGASFLAAMPPSISELEYLARRLTSLHRKTLAEREAGTVTILIGENLVEFTVGDGSVTVQEGTGAADVHTDSAGFMDLILGVLDPETLTDDPTLVSMLSLLRPAA